MLQNVKQIPKASTQQKTLTFEPFETLLTRHIEKRLTAMQKKFESYFAKISKIVANIECCQNQNTKTLQQNITNLKNEFFSKNEIITTPINKPIYLKKVNLMLQYKNHHIRKPKPNDTTKDHN